MEVILRRGPGPEHRIRILHTCGGDPKEDLDNPEKANGALNDVVKELNSKGYKVTDQQTRDLEALREWVLTQLRMKQAQSGVEDVGIAKDVPAEDILSPVDQLPKTDTSTTTTEGDENGK